MSIRAYNRLRRAADEMRAGLQHADAQGSGDHAAHCSVGPAPWIHHVSSPCATSARVPPRDRRMLAPLGLVPLVLREGTVGFGKRYPDSGSMRGRR